MHRLAALTVLIVLALAPLAYPAHAEPLPSGVTVEVYAGGRSFPVAMDFAPDGRLFYTEKGSGNPSSPRIVTLSGSPGILTETTWLQLSGVDSSGERGLLGITLDPQFATNGYVYIFYTNASSPRANRVVRYTERRTGPNAGTADPASALILMEVPITAAVDPNTNHNGGNLHFGPDGYLYVTHGELGRTPSWAQDLTIAPGKIHRLDVRAPYNSTPNAARAPTTNPFYDDGNPATGNDDRIWSYGHRNSFDFTFDTYDPPGATVASGFLFATENGPQCNDEILRVVKGYNYRWPLDNSCPSPPQNATGPVAGDPAIPPLHYYGSPTIAPTGIEVYTGAISEWRGDLFFCAINTSRLYRAELNSSRTALTAAPQPVDLPGGAACGLDVVTGQDGALYFATASTIYRARPNTPTALSLTMFGAAQQQSDSPNHSLPIPWLAALMVGIGIGTLEALRRRL